MKEAGISRNTLQILVVDGNIHNRSTIKSVLSPLNARIFERATVDGSFFLAGDNRPDLVIVHAKALSQSGSSIAMLCKDKPLPLILIGSSVADADIKKGPAAGARVCLQESEVAVKLVSAVEEIFKESTEKPVGKRILVVDDSVSVRMMLQEGLSREGYQVLLAENGRIGLETVRSTRLDLILSDVYMPEMNGLEFCETLHRNPLYSNIPFVVMSTENDAHNMRHMMRNGAAAFIIKPFNLEQLMMTLNKIFSYEFLLLLKEKERLDIEQKLLIAGITGLVKALEARDQYTRGHSERVSRILAGLVRHSGGSALEIERSLMAGRLHDIGKIGIRDDVLLKPGALSAEEFTHIKQHPSIGAAILQSMPSLADILPVVCSHHERMDGKGYPQGLEGEAIPLWARMTAVADTYDALTSDRPYRKGMAHEKAVDIIKGVAGTQLCPESVSLFFAWCRNKEPENIGM